jgi:MFS family permease
VLVALLAVEGVLVAALDVLFVVLAVDVLERGEGWAGYLQMAFGLGAVASALVTARLVDRRLAPAVIAAALVTGAALALTAPGPGLAVTVAVVVIAGMGRAVLDVSTRTLLLRITPHRATAQVFGVVEGFVMGGLAVGSLLVPALVAIGGPAAALVGAAALLPLAVAATFARLVRLDAEAPDHRRALAALRTSTVFAHLPQPALEELAGAAAPTRFASGATLIREGEPGLDYHLITAGEVEASQGGRVVGRIGPGDGVGEIALIRRVPRTATVTALTAVETLRLDGPAFLEAIARGATTT